MMCLTAYNLETRKFTVKGLTDKVGTQMAEQTLILSAHLTG